MDSQLGFIWTIEYVINEPWEKTVGKKYFLSEDEVNTFAKTHGLVKNKIERCLGVKVGTEIFSLGSPIKISPKE